MQIMRANGVIPKVICEAFYLICAALNNYVYTVISRGNNLLLLLLSSLVICDIAKDVLHSMNIIPSCHLNASIVC